MPSLVTRTLAAFGFAREEASSASGMADGVRPPSRDEAGYVTTERALTLSTVFRAVQIHTTAVSQLSMRVERGGETVTPTPAIVAEPSVAMSRSDFLEQVVACLYLDGNAFLKLTRSALGLVIDIEVLDPRQVYVRKDSDTQRVTFAYGKRTDYTTREISHIKFLNIPGFDRGLGPIQAARAEIAGALDARDYGSSWFTESGMPSGLLTTDDALTSDEAELYRRTWDGLDENGEKKAGTSAHRTRVLGKGLNYVPMLLKPSDVQFLESQQFSTTQIARLFGIPASLMLAATEGNSQTYSNVEQDWIAYVRFSLMNPLRKIEEAFSRLLVRGQTARFTIESLLRTDTKTRYEGHKIALDWMTDDEIRAIEGLPALTDAQREQIAARRKSTPTAIKETAND